jgi:hypothetical protein
MTAQPSLRDNSLGERFESQHDQNRSRGPAAMLYRVIVSETDCKQPKHSDTHWRRQVLYCGTNVDEARIAFHASEPQDFSRGAGTAARETDFETLDDRELSDRETGTFGPPDMEGVISLELGSLEMAALETAAIAAGLGPAQFVYKLLMKRLAPEGSGQAAD